MKVILLAKVAGLGNIDDVKDVADGYAMNFLFPRHLAVQASKSAITELDAQRKKKAKEEENDLREQQSLADRLDGLELKFTDKVSDKGQLYSAITAQKIAERLALMKLSVDKKQITVPPIKAAGEFNARVKFRHGLSAKVRIIVSAQ